MDQIKIGKFIAQLRKEHNLTQQAMGEKIGVTNKTISRWENGNYMPDIEMLLILSKLFGVTVNELLSGERLTEELYIERAEENIVAAFRESCFNRKERMEFFSKKWLRDHLADIIISALAVIAVTAWALLSGETLIAALCPAAAVIIYCIHRNRMMIYCENKVYGENEVKK